MSTDAFGIARAVAKQLGREWKATPGNHPTEPRLVGPGGHVLLLEAGPRIAIRGLFQTPDLWQELLPEEHGTCNITVAFTTAPDKIAGHIRRRLLPTYSRLLAEVTERAFLTKVGKEDQARLLEKLAAILPDSTVLHGDKVWFTPFGRHHHGEAYVPDGAAQVKFTVDVPIHHALAVAEYLRDLNNDKEADR